MGGNSKEEGIAMKNELQKMQKSIGYGSEIEIDQRIATIEFKLNTWAISLKEEKKYLLELQELKRNRPKVSKVNNMQDKLTAHKEGVSGNMQEMKATIQEINAAMAKHREEKRSSRRSLRKFVMSARQS